ncbi:MAG: hypothetical protein KKH99_03065, partial [Proteobacteria bacterium]|nr:hypothetical protein [Pseudomonadota bacterium]
MKLFCVNMICFLLFFSSPALGLVPDDQQIHYENGLVSFSSSMPLDGFLMQLARKANIQLFV